MRPRPATLRPGPHKGQPAAEDPAPDGARCGSTDLAGWRPAGPPHSEKGPEPICQRRGALPPRRRIHRWGPTPRYSGKFLAPAASTESGRSKATVEITEHCERSCAPARGTDSLNRI